MIYDYLLFFYSKYVSLNLRIPKEDLQHVLNLVETHGNEYLNKLKQIVLWENMTTSGIVCFLSYFNQLS